MPQLRKYEIDALTRAITQKLAEAIENEKEAFTGTEQYRENANTISQSDAYIATIEVIELRREKAKLEAKIKELSAIAKTLPVPDKKVENPWGGMQTVTYIVSTALITSDEDQEKELHFLDSKVQEIIVDGLVSKMPTTKDIEQKVVLGSFDGDPEGLIESIVNGFLNGNN